MTREEAIRLIQAARMMLLGKDNQPVSDLYKALDMAIAALENIGHLTDRPCDVCEFNKENGCCKWECVFSDGLFRGMRGAE